MRTSKKKIEKCLVDPAGAGVGRVRISEAYKVDNLEQCRAQSSDADLNQPVLLLHEDLVDGLKVVVDQHPYQRNRGFLNSQL